MIVGGGRSSRGGTVVIRGSCRGRQTNINISQRISVYKHIVHESEGGIEISACFVLLKAQLCEGLLYNSSSRANGRLMTVPLFISTENSIA